MSVYAQARQHPGRPAVVDVSGAVISYGELIRRANQLSRALADLGASRGDRVLTLVGNRPAFLEIAVATAQSGLYFVPVNRRSSAEEFRHFATDSRPVVVIAEADVAARTTDVLEQSGVTERRRFSFEPVGGWRDYHELGVDLPCDEPQTRSAGGMMIYTSGTSGRPKAVRRALPDGPPRPYDPVAVATSARLGYVPGPGVHLVACPLYHAGPGGFALRALHLGQTVVLMERFDAEEVLRLIERHRVTTTHLVPTMFHRMLRLAPEIRARYDLSSLTSVVHGAAPCPPHVKQDMIDWLGQVVYEYYGSTEAGLVTATTSAQWLAAPGTAGTAMPGVQLRILDDEHKDVPAGEVGTVYHSLAVPNFEYLGDKEKTAAARVDEFVTVGDLGCLDQEGRLFLRDRRTDLIISGGVNIYPAEVEARLLAHPLVADAAVVGEPDDEWGQRVVAYVQPVEPGDDTLPDRLAEFCRDGLARFKVPRRIEVVARLPRTESGKMRRRLVQGGQS
ncbi:acyl-CoA synthetase [Kibdelosporangium phytohabitans]|uniref:Acyl-CoA synthetase n=1 Tax=Kibdelosporangium phytohabitans TaxID=860235 RepID=A0A0N7F5W6_9PSEU|nr:AMP-binding protein [Kibdelosporangium phytohabitans]ALG15375.1 acyl-CoA synthetase [Kibdelosporangium phytohabitans]